MPTPAPVVLSISCTYDGPLVITGKKPNNLPSFVPVSSGLKSEARLTVLVPCGA